MLIIWSSTSLYRGIEKEKAELIKEATFRAFMEVKKHTAFVIKLAEKLAEKLWLSGDEVREMWKQYITDSNNKK